MPLYLKDKYGNKVKIAGSSSINGMTSANIVGGENIIITEDKTKGEIKIDAPAVDNLQTEVDSLKSSVSEGKAAIAGAITDKGVSTSSTATFSEMANNINMIETSSGTDTDDATATASDILSPKTAYARGEKITGTMEEVSQATPSIAVSSSGLITATSVQAAGHVLGGTKTATSQLITQAAETITPGTSERTIVVSGRYTTGAIKVAGDANLVPGNIRKGVSIFDVIGTHGGYDTSDATAAKTDILYGKTAYGPSGKITGSMMNQGAVSKSIYAGSSYTIPAGYHNGQGKVNAIVDPNVYKSYSYVTLTVVNSIDNTVVFYANRVEGTLDTSKFTATAISGIVKSIVGSKDTSTFTNVKTGSLIIYKNFNNISAVPSDAIAFVEGNPTGQGNWYNTYSLKAQNNGVIVITLT